MLFGQSHALLLISNRKPCTVTNRSDDGRESRCTGRADLFERLRMDEELSVDKGPISPAMPKHGTSVIFAQSVATGILLVPDLK